MQIIFAGSRTKYLGVNIPDLLKSFWLRGRLNISCYCCCCCFCPSLNEHVIWQDLLIHCCIFWTTFLKINNTVNYAAKSVLHQNFKYSRSFIMHKSQPATPSDAGSAECHMLCPGNDSLHSSRSRPVLTNDHKQMHHLFFLTKHSLADEGAKIRCDPHSAFFKRPWGRREGRWWFDRKPWLAFLVSRLV